MIFEREIGMSDTLLDALWLEGYSISFAVGALKTILDQLGEERVRKYCPDITDEILAALKELGKDCTDDEYNLFEKKYEADIMKMQNYKGRERVKEIELDEYGRLMDEERDYL